MNPDIEPSLPRLIRWMTGITRPVHAPLLVSAVMRIVHLIGNIAMLGLACGGVIMVAQGRWSLTSWGMGLLAVAAIKASCAYFEQLTGHYVAFKALELLRTHAFAALWPAAPAVLQEERSGDLFTSLTRDIDRIEVVYAHTFAPLIAAFVVPGAVLIGTGFCVSWLVVAVPALCMVVLSCGLLLVGTRASMASTARTLELRRDLAQHVTDSVFGAEEVTSYGRENDRLTAMGELDAAVGQAAAVARRHVAVKAALTTGASLIATMWIAYIGLWQGLDLALVCALTAGSLKLSEGPAGLRDAVSYLDHSFAAARRMWRLCNRPLRVPDEGQTSLPSGALAVEWENVSYRYPESTRDAVKQVSIKVPAGSHAVIMGNSGSGKSSLVQLLQRWDDPTSGTVLLGGIPVTQIPLDELRHAVVFVSQRVDLLCTSIAENLRLGNPQASEADLWEALAAVEMEAEIAATADGLDTQVGEAGTGLSGGQAQRLSLARALLMKPRVLVLDEFTSSINPELEAQIRMNLRRCCPNVTMVEVSHGSEHMVDADQIVLLDAGQRVAAEAEERVPLA